MAHRSRDERAGAAAEPDEGSRSALEAGGGEVSVVLASAVFQMVITMSFSISMMYSTVAWVKLQLTGCVVTGTSRPRSSPIRLIYTSQSLIMAEVA
jgi:hypothetical protein